MISQASEWLRQGGKQDYRKTGITGTRGHGIRNTTCVVTAITKIYVTRETDKSLLLRNEDD